MPSVSKRQFGYFGMIASGKKKVKGISREKAKEWLRGVDYKSLPTRVNKKTSKQSKVK